MVRWLQQIQTLCNFTVFIQLLSKIIQPIADVSGHNGPKPTLNDENGENLYTPFTRLSLT